MAQDVAPSKCSITWTIVLPISHLTKAAVRSPLQLLPLAQSRSLPHCPGCLSSTVGFLGSQGQTDVVVVLP